MSDPSNWIPDHTVKECMKCGKEFGLFTRKHHCRTCGKVYCAAETCLIKQAETGQWKCLACVSKSSVSLTGMLRVTNSTSPIHGSASNAQKEKANNSVVAKNEIVYYKDAPLPEDM